MWVTSKGKRKLNVVPEGFTYIPLCQSLQQLLQHEKVRELILTQPNYARHGFLSNICNGSIFRNHPTFRENSQSLQLILYYDDLEICNPLGKGAGLHKVGIFYYTLGNLPPFMCS